MSQEPTYRLSTTRRIEKFIRFMDTRFPAAHAHGVPWFDCIDTTKLDVRNTSLCIFSQLADTDYFGHALAVLNIRDTNVILKHIGVMNYNSSDRAIDKGFARAEAVRLNTAFKAAIETMQAANRSPARITAEEIVTSAASRA